MLTRFWNKVDKSGACWEWTASKDKDGYGLFHFNRKQVRAHRFAFGLDNIPKGMAVCHTCDNPGCVNPDHLFLGTNLDNTQDMISKGRNTLTSYWKGKKMSADIRAKMSKSKIGSRNSMYGRKHTLEAIEKIRQAKLEYYRNR